MCVRDKIKYYIKISRRDRKIDTLAAYDLYGSWILLTRRYPERRRHAVRRRRIFRVCKARCRRKCDDDSRSECCSIPSRSSPLPLFKCSLILSLSFSLSLSVSSSRTWRLSCINLGSVYHGFSYQTNDTRTTGYTRNEKNDQADRDNGENLLSSGCDDTRDRKLVFSD